MNKIYTSKAHINSVQLQMKNQLATVRVAGSLAKSTEVMQAMQALVKLASGSGRIDAGNVERDDEGRYN